MITRTVTRERRRKQHVVAGGGRGCQPSPPGGRSSAIGGRVPVQRAGLGPQDDAVRDVGRGPALLVPAEDADDLSVAVDPWAAAGTAGEVGTLDALLRTAVRGGLVRARDRHVTGARVSGDGDRRGAGGHS